MPPISFVSPPTSVGLMLSAFLPFPLLSHGGDAAGGGYHLPPLHPILVNFTAALIPASVLSDWLGRWLKRDGLRHAAWWMLLYAGIVTPFTAAAGWWWMRDMEGMNDWRLAVHQWLGTSIAAVAVALAVWRGRSQRAARTPGMPYLILATLLVGALVVQGELGGQMSFGSTDHTDDRSQHGPTPTSRDTGHRDSRSPASTPSTRPATGPSSDHDHQHHEGALQWREQIDLNG